MILANKGRDLFVTHVNLPLEGIWEFYIEGWADIQADYDSMAEIKLKLNQDVDLVKNEAKIVSDKLKNNPKPHLTKTSQYKIFVSRDLSLNSSWYQIFPRSLSNLSGGQTSRTHIDGESIQGDFWTASKELPRIKNMGFDIVYLPPIHPIGIDHRKGKNNSLNATIKDPGSPWAVGTSEGGHDSVDKRLGGLDGFRHFVKESKKLGLEVSLDFALQCSPNHPWVKSHPNWFKHRSDGTIQYAENPPKKYQDIYPIYFDDDFDGIVNETIRIMNFWIGEGVTIFRVDNPHTKPVAFWEKVISTIKSTNPEILFLAEAFTKPPMMKALGYAGYDQSHSYFLWRNTKKEILKYIEQITEKDGYYTHSTFWPTTPDNLTDYLVKGGVVAHKIRAILAALGSTTYGIYAGYELVENEYDDKKKEHNNNEKYEIYNRNWENAKKYGIEELLTKLNTIRKENIALQNINNFVKHTTSSPKILAFSKHSKDNNILVIVNLAYDGDPIDFNLTLKEKQLKIKGAEFKNEVQALDLLTGSKYLLDKKTKFTLDPKIGQALVLSY